MRNVSVTFGGVKALQDVSFEVLPGEVQCIAGENGSGKSTLIKVITGVYQPLAGAQMAFAGKTVDTMSPAAARAAGIEVIWQDLALFPEMTVAENIGIRVGARQRAAPRQSRRHAHGRATGCSRGSAPTSMSMRRCGRFAIAQRQIVAIARALAGDAKVIFMDEPTSSLTQSETDRLLDIVRSLAAEGMSIVFVSHRLAEVLEISTRVTVLRDGKLVGVYPTAGMTQSRLTELMTGKTFDQGVRTRDHSHSPAVLAVEGLTRAGDYEDVSLTIRRGETVGLTGLLGAGRTELALSIFGMLRPDRGRISLNGAALDLRLQPRRHPRRHRLSLRGSPRARTDPAAIDRRQSGDPGARQDPRRAASSRFAKKDALVASWIDELAIKIGQPTDAISTLSGGNQQRVAIAKWLAAEPQAHHSRRPDGRRRRRRPRRHLRDRRAARGRRARDPSDLRRGARGLLQRRPRAAHGGGQDRRRIRSAHRLARRDLEAAVYA